MAQHRRTRPARRHPHGVSSLPEELLQEILVRLSADEPVHLARASLVCKGWHCVLSDRDCFLRRCREFHGAPPLLGFIQNRYNREYDSNLTIRFVPATSIASPVRLPAVNCSGWCALDCRHGRVLIHAKHAHASSKRLIVWDPVTGGLQHLSVHGRYPSNQCYYVGAVLCAKQDGCDHLDCHGGPFLVVILENRRADDPNGFTCASIYSSETKTWSRPFSNGTNHRFNCRTFSANRKHSLLIGGAVYFPFGDDNIILKYDLRAHSSSEIDMPQYVYGAFLMKAEDGGIGLASQCANCICLWSQKGFTNGTAKWVQYRVMELETLLPRCVQFESYKVIGFVEGTNTIFINIITSGIFALDLKSKKVRKVVGKREAGQFDDPILPYTSFYTPR